MQKVGPTLSQTEQVISRELHARVTQNGNSHISRVEVHSTQSVLRHTHPMDHMPSPMLISPPHEKRHQDSRGSARRDSYREQEQMAQDRAMRSRQNFPYGEEPFGEMSMHAAEATMPPTPDQDSDEFYQIVSQVGEGTFGKVYKARNTNTGQFVALKRIRMEAERDGFPVTAMREIKLLQSIRHENVIRLYEMMVSNGEESSPLACFLAR